MALTAERYKKAAILSLLYFPFFSSLRNVLSTPLYLGFANLVYGYHCPRSIVTNLLFPRRILIALQLRRCRCVIVAPLGLPKNRRPFVTLGQPKPCSPNRYKWANKEANARGNAIYNWAVREGLTIKNKNGTPTRRQTVQGQVEESMLDLAWKREEGWKMAGLTWGGPDHTIIAVRNKFKNEKRDL